MKAPTSRILKAIVRACSLAEGAGPDAGRLDAEAEEDLRGLPEALAWARFQLAALEAKRGRRRKRNDYGDMVKIVAEQTGRARVTVYRVLAGDVRSAPIERAIDEYYWRIRDGVEMPDKRAIGTPGHLRPGQPQRALPE